jgi:serine/threonine protein kinase
MSSLEVASLVRKTGITCNTPSSKCHTPVQFFSSSRVKGTVHRDRRPSSFAGGLVASIFHQFVQGLHHVHAAGYFHHDMKPKNIL